MTQGLFITGTGTDVGKTLITCALVSQLRAKGIAVQALKPVASGVDPAALGESDPGRIVEALGGTVTPDSVAGTAPWLFKAPLAPNMAARREGAKLAFNDVVAFCRARIDAARGPVLIEGVGGVMAPVTDDRLVLDWIVELELPAVIVAGAALGTISHTLSAVEALKARGGPVAGVVVSDQGDGPVPLNELIGTLDRFLRGVPIYGFGPVGAGPAPWTRVPPLTDLLGSRASV